MYFMSLSLLIAKVKCLRAILSPMLAVVVKALSLGFLLMSAVLLLTWL